MVATRFLVTIEIVANQYGQYLGGIGHVSAQCMYAHALYSRPIEDNAGGAPEGDECSSRCVRKPCVPDIDIQPSPING